VQIQLLIVHASFPDPQEGQAAQRVPRRAARALHALLHVAGWTLLFNHPHE
jgi:hypothetical protein